MTLSDTIAWALCTAAIPAAWWLWHRDIIRPGSFQRLGDGGRERNVAGIPGLMWLLGAIVLYLSTGVFAALAASLPHSISGTPDSMQRRAITSIVGYTAAAAIGIAIVYLLRAGGGRLAADPNAPTTEPEGLRWRPKDLLIGLGCLALLAPFYQLTATLSTAAATWFTGQPPPLLAHDALTRIVEHRTDPWVWALAAALVIGPPIVEELIYRVFIQSALVGLFQRFTAPAASTSPELSEGSGAAFTSPERSEGSDPAATSPARSKGQCHPKRTSGTIDPHSSCPAQRESSDPSHNSPPCRSLHSRLVKTSRRTLGATYPAILTTSALFALMHIAAGGPVPWHAAPGLFVLSLGLGIAYERAARRGGGPLTPIGMHATFNAINMALALTQAQ